MTTATWTASAITTDIPGNAGASLVHALRKLGQFVAVFFGATAEEDSAYRGLDLNGNAVWAASAQR